MINTLHLISRSAVGIRFLRGAYTRLVRRPWAEAKCRPGEDLYTHSLNDRYLSRTTKLGFRMWNSGDPKPTFSQYIYHKIFVSSWGPTNRKFGILVLIEPQKHKMEVFGRPKVTDHRIAITTKPLDTGDLDISNSVLTTSSY